LTPAKPIIFTLKRSLTLLPSLPPLSVSGFRTEFSNVNLINMKSTLSRLGAKFKGKSVPWVQRIVDQYVAYLEKHHPELKVHKTPFAKLQ
jgi:hypothetical protein